MIGSTYRETPKTIPWRITSDRGTEPMNIKDWMRNWQDRFASLGVEVLVADVAQSCVAVDIRDRTVILAPSLKLSVAEKILQKVYEWWRHQSDRVEGQLWSLLSC